MLEIHNILTSSESCRGTKKEQTMIRMMTNEDWGNKSLVLDIIIQYANSHAYIKDLYVRKMFHNLPELPRRRQTRWKHQQVFSVESLPHASLISDIDCSTFLSRIHIAIVLDSLTHKFQKSITAPIKLFSRLRNSSGPRQLSRRFRRHSREIWMLSGWRLN